MLCHVVATTNSTSPNHATQTGCVLSSFPLKVPLRCDVKTQRPHKQPADGQGPAIAMSNHLESARCKGHKTQFNIPVKYKFLQDPSGWQMMPNAQDCGQKTQEENTNPYIETKQK